MGNAGCLSKSVRKDFHDPGLDDLGKSLRKQEFALDWVLPACRDDSMTGYLNKSYLEGRQTRSETTAVFCKQQQSLILDQR